MPPPLCLPAAVSLGPKHQIPGRENALAQLEWVSRPSSETMISMALQPGYVRLLGGGECENIPEGGTPA